MIGPLLCLLLKEILQLPVEVDQFFPVVYRVDFLHSSAVAIIN